MQALSISKELTDVRAERAVLRLLARGYRAVGPLRSLITVDTSDLTGKLINMQLLSVRQAAMQIISVCCNLLILQAWNFDSA